MSQSRPQVEPLHRFLRWMAQTKCFRPRTVLLRVRTMGDVVSGICPKTPQKGAWMGTFKPKRQKLYNRNICGTITPTIAVWGPSSDHERHFVVGSPLPRWIKINVRPLPQSKYNRAARPTSRKLICLHISLVGGPIWIKSVRLMQNNMPITVIWSKSKPEVEFQYGERLFFQTESSYMSAANWDISPKIGLRIDFDLLKRVIDVNTVSSLEPVTATSKARSRGRMARGINSLECDSSPVSLTSLTDCVVIARVSTVSYLCNNYSTHC